MNSLSRTSPNLPGWLLRLLRRTLYLWTRPKVFPETPDKLGLRANLPVVYVLQYRHLSNALVLDQETRNLSLPKALRPLQSGEFSARTSVFFLNSETSDDAWRAPAEPAAEAGMLVQLVREAIRNPDFDVQLVPVTILWGRAPQRQESILKALFAEAWQSMGVLSQLVATLVNGRDTVVRFSEPASLRELLRSEQREDRAAHKLSRILRVHFRRQREIAIGPNLSHRQTQLHSLLSRPEVREAIAADAIRRSVPFAQAESAAARYAMEIASDFSYSIVQALVQVLNWVWTRIYDGLEVHNFERIADVARSHGIVYIPCHRSHIDYLLISFILYTRGMSLPHIAAGANLNIPVLGPILRRGGAFFLRRKIKGNALYATIFNEYVSLMVSQGFPIEYFIEGGRSRSGRTLRPKTGMLSMTIQSFVRNRSRPLAFVPIYIGYEKLMEGNTYLAELGGKPKKGESLLGLLSTVRELRKYFGKVHINVGRPLLLSNLLDQRHPDWATEPPNPKAPWLRNVVGATAGELARRINAAATVNPINLVALALLSTPKHTADQRQLKVQIGHLQYLLRKVPYSDSVHVSDISPCDAIDHAIRLELVRRQTHALGDIVIAAPEQSSLLAYFRNNVLHLLALPALLACLVSHNRLLSRERAKEAITGIYALLRAELFLHWELADIDALLDHIETAFVERGLIVVDSELGLLRSPLPSAEANAELRQIGEVIRPTLERQYLTLALLQHHGSGKLTRATLEESGHLLAQRLSILYEFNSPEFSERTLFGNMIQNLIDAEFLKADADGYLHFDQHITTPAAHTELLLSPAVRHSIERIARAGALPETIAEAPPSAPAGSAPATPVAAPTGPAPMPLPVPDHAELTGPTLLELAAAESTADEPSPAPTLDDPQNP